MFPDRFETSRLVLHPVAAADTESIFVNYAQDPDVTRFLTWRPHTSIAQTRNYVQACIDAEGARTFMLRRRNEDEVVGALDLRQTATFRIEFGYVLARPAWGQGLMTEALLAVLQWALNQPSIWRIAAVADAANVASLRVMEKAGLEREGLLRKWLVHPNVGDVPRDCFSYAGTRRES